MRKTTTILAVVALALAAPAVYAGTSPAYGSHSVDGGGSNSGTVLNFVATGTKAFNPPAYFGSGPTWYEETEEDSGVFTGTYTNVNPPAVMAVKTITFTGTHPNLVYNVTVEEFDENGYSLGEFPFLTGGTMVHTGP